MPPQTKFLIDENIHKDICKILTNLGYQVRHISDIQQGINDSLICELAIESDEVIITFDKDFIFNLKKKYRKNSKIIFVKMNQSISSSLNETIQILHTWGLLTNPTGVLIVQNTDGEVNFRYIY